LVLDSKQTPKLRRAIRLPEATSMVVGTIIGSTIFVQPSSVTSLVPSVGGITLVWLAAGILTMFGALVCAELASIFTKSGGVYVYLKEAFSPAVGFLWGWAMFWVMHSGIIAAIAVIFARYVAFFLPLGDFEIKLVAMASILVLSAVNYLGVKHGSTLQTFITIVKVSAIILMIVLGIVFGSNLPEHFVIGSDLNTDVTFTNFLLAMAAGLFTYGGWHMVTYNAEETVEPRKTIPRALILGTIIVTLCYIAITGVYMYVLPLEQVISSTRIAADTANALFGFGGGALMSGLVVLSAFGALSGIILAGPRVYLAMARDGLLFRWAGKIHPRYNTPAMAIIIQAVWSSVLVTTGTYKQLFIRVIYTEWIFFALMAVALFIFRARPHIKRDYHIWGYPVVPVIFIIASSAIVINQIISDPGESFVGLALILAGLPVYYLWTRKKV
jgi:basic amino acid/polyamine antiporter, APA family